MKPLEILNSCLEDELYQWISKFSSLEELFAARRDLFQKLHSQNLGGSIDSYVSIDGAVHTSDGALIRAFSVIRGPSIIGPNVLIESNSLIEQGSFIGTNTKIMHGATIKDSIILNNTIIEPGTFISNAIIGSNVIIRAGSIINGSEKKGIVIADNVTVEAHSVITEETTLPEE